MKLKLIELTHPFFIGLVFFKFNFRCRKFKLKFKFRKNSAKMFKLLGYYKHVNKAFSNLSNSK